MGRAFRSRWAPLAVFLLVTLVFASGWRYSQHHEHTMVDLKSTLTCEQVTIRLETYLDVRLALVRQLGHEWERGHIDSSGSFVGHATSIREHFTSVEALSLLDRNGTVIVVVPLEPDRAALRTLLTEDASIAPTLRGARESGALCVSRPLDLPGMGRGIVALQRLVHRGQEDGFVAILFRLEPLVEDCLARGVRGQFWLAIDDQGQHIYGELEGGSAGVDDPGAVARSFAVGDRRWRVALAPREEIVAAVLTPTDEVLFAIGVVVAAGLALLTWRVTRSSTALRESRERLEALAEHIPGVVYSYDVVPGRGRSLIFLGPGLGDLIGPEAAAEVEASFDRLFELIHPDDRTSLARAVERNAGAGTTVDCELRLRGEGGGWRWVRSLGRAQRVDAQTTRWHIVLIDIAEQKRALERQRLMLNELDHRVKNNLAAVLSLSDQTLASAGSLEEFRGSFTGRIAALARAHEALSRGRWESVDLGEMVRLVLEPYAGEQQRIRTSGEHAPLHSRLAMPLAIVLHELATNAAKHGALSHPAGRVMVTWSTEGDGGLRLLWEELDGPAVAPPRHAGFGMRLMRGLVENEIGGMIRPEFAPRGFSCEIATIGVRSKRRAQEMSTSA